MGKISLDKELIKELSELLVENNLSEISVTQGRNTIKIARKIGSSEVISHTFNSDKIDNSKIEKKEEILDGGAVRSPMVGTIYLAPSPDAKPFITVGQSVKEGDQLFIVEAMKTMNPVKSPYNGIVKKIVVENETPIEYDEVLAIIEIS
tara:strand:+ start:8145 stop:8591 length:447 start_codon:yes stop_codon:yes gene_type:complete